MRGVPRRWRRETLLASKHDLSRTVFFAWLCGNALSTTEAVLYIDRGSFWGNRGDAEDDGIDPHSLLYSDDIAHPWQDGGYREIRWMPSFDPYDDYEYKQWGSMTFEEFLAYFNITVTEKYPECVA